MKQRVTTVFASVVLALALFGGAMAGPLEDGVAAAARGDYATALPLLRPLAERGDPDAQFELGHMYATGGPGVPEDLLQAVEFYTFAARQGNTKAQLNLSGLYLIGGEGLPQNFLIAYTLAYVSALEGNHSGGELRETIGRLLTPEERAAAKLQAETLAQKWKPK